MLILRTAIACHLFVDYKSICQVSIKIMLPFPAASFSPFIKKQRLNVARDSH